MLAAGRNRIEDYLQIVAYPNPNPRRLRPALRPVARHHRKGVAAHVGDEFGVGERVYGRVPGRITGVRIERGLGRRPRPGGEPGHHCFRYAAK